MTEKKEISQCVLICLELALKKVKILSEQNTTLALGVGQKDPISSKKAYGLTENINSTSSQIKQILEAIISDINNE